MGSHEAVHCDSMKQWLVHTMVAVRKGWGEIIKKLERNQKYVGFDRIFYRRRNGLIQVSLALYERYRLAVDFDSLGIQVS